MTSHFSPVQPAAQSPAQAPEPNDPSRRQVLCGLAIALLAPGALAAACGDSGTTSTGGATTGGATGGATTGGGSANALAKLSDIPVGGGVLVDGPNGKVLLVQPTAGTVKAYNPRCTHMGTQVNPPQGGVITCPNHGSQFNPADGSATKGPATSPLGAVNVRVDGTDVVLA